MIEVDENWGIPKGISSTRNQMHPNQNITSLSPTVMFFDRTTSDSANELLHMHTSDGDLLQTTPYNEKFRLALVYRFLRSLYFSYYLTFDLSGTMLQKFLRRPFIPSNFFSMLEQNHSKYDLFQ